MKKVLTITSIALFSSIAQAENSPLNQNQSTHAIATEGNIVTEFVLAKNEANIDDLWEYLDLNNDGSISKMEAAISAEVFDNWDKLDANKDKKLDTDEFAQLLSVGNK